jgi:hypothetical protein
MGAVRPAFFLFFLAACASATPDAPHNGASQARDDVATAPPPATPPPSTPPPPDGGRVQAPPPETPPPPVAPVFTVQPAIAKAIASIEARAYARDLGAIVGERNDRTTPAHLAKVTAYVEAELTKAGFRVRRETIRHGTRSADQLIADRPGSDPTKVVAVGAHLDTVPGSPGADDDGSGIAGLLAIARATKGVATTKGLRIYAFAFEEDGLVGASQHVANLPEPDRAAIAAMIDMDMIGYRDSRPGSQRYPPGIEQLVRQPLPDSGDFIAAVGIEGEPILPAMTHAQQYVPDLRAGVVPLRRWQIFAAPDTMRGDHAPFWLAGIPAAQVGDTGNFRNPHYHQPSDRLETVDVEFATLVSRWVTATLLTLAGVP